MATLFAAAWGVFGWGFGIRPLNDNSYLWHEKTGEWILDHGIPRGDIFSFTAAGSPWVAQSWLAEVLYGGLHRLAGPSAVRLSGAVVGFLLAFLSYRLAARLSGHRVLAAFLIIPPMIASAVLWLQRPMFLALLPMLALVWIVEVPESATGRRPLLCIPPLMWLWANIHGSFALGFGYLALHLAGRWLDGAPPWRDRERRLVQAALAGFALCFVNPYGIDLVLFPVKLMMRGDILSAVDEWQSPDFRSVPGMAFAVWIAVLVLGLTLARVRPSRRDVVVVLPFVLLGLWAQRNISLVPLIGLPVLARQLAVRRAPEEERRPLNGALLVLIVLLGGVLTAQGLSKPAYAVSDRYPVAAVRALEQRGLLGRRLLTTDEWAGYVIHTYWPRQRVFFDDRYDMYPTALTKDYLQLINARPAWRTVLDRHRIDVVTWPTDHPISEFLATSPGWRLVYRDAMAVIYVRG
jgi:hypothetical protein